MAVELVKSLTKQSNNVQKSH